MISLLKRWVSGKHKQEVNKEYNRLAGLLLEGQDILPAAGTETDVRHLRYFSGEGVFTVTRVIEPEQAKQFLEMLANYNVEHTTAYHKDVLGIKPKEVLAAEDFLGAEH